MTLGQLAGLVLKKWYVVVIAVLLIGGGAFAASKAQTPVFEATRTEYVTLSFGSSPNELAQGSTYTQSQMVSFGQLATSSTVLQPVIDRLGLPKTVNQLARDLDISTPRDTVVLQITASATDREGAAAVANAVGDELANAIERLAPKDTDGNSLVQVSPIEQAVAPVYQSKPNTTRNTALAILIGLVVGAGMVILIDRSDTRVRTAATLEELTDLPFLGSVRERRDAEGHELVVTQAPTSLGAEDYRQLRASLQFIAMGRQPLVLAVTSAIPGEGKSTVSANLAAVLAEAGQRTVLVDLDLRRPKVARYTQAEPLLGVTGVIIGQATVDEVIQPLGDTGLDVVTSGVTPPNPGEIMSSTAMVALLADLRSRYDFVIVDTPPVLAVADAVTIAARVDGVLMVTHRRRVHRSQVTKAVATLRAGGIRPLGMILNAARGAQRGHETKYASYATGATATPDAPPAPAARREPEGLVRR